MGTGDRMRYFEEKDLVQVSCNLCGRSETKVIALRPDGLKVEECLKCGLAYLNPRPNDDVISRLYDREYYHGGDHLRSYSTSDFLEDTQRALEDKTHMGFKLIRKIAEYQNLRGSRLLDVGCACGASLVIARSYGSLAEGVELSDFSAELGRKKFGVKIKTGTLQSADYPNQHFDIVTMFELVEHIPDPLTLFKEVYRILKANGLICISTPNYNCHLKYGSKWLGFTKSFEHIFFFNDTSLKALLGTTGFEVIFSQTIEVISPLGRAILFDEKRRRRYLRLRNRLAKISWLFSSARHIWKTFTSLQAKQNERAGFGQTLLIIAQKKEMHV
jgi:2-polyprenyl-3-methyl-5-hydroxy-6-metoxy-1,4-benzoquinol methylase